MISGLMELGARIRDAYAVSARDGQAAWMSHVGESLQVFHVPGLPSDGQPITREQMLQAGVGENELFATLAVRITVESLRPAGDDMLIVETAFTGAPPGGSAFRFPLTLIFRFSDGKIERLIQVGSPDMSAVLRQAVGALHAGHRGSE